MRELGLFLADVDAIAVYGTLIVAIVLAAAAYSAKKVSDEMERKLSEVEGRLQRLQTLIERIDSERKAAAEASNKKVGRAALEKIFSETLDFINASFGRRV